MDERLSVAPVVPRFAEAVRNVAGVEAFYAGGSIGSRDYRPGISDLDLVAVIAAPLSRAGRGRLRDLHRTIGAAKLHCAYVPIPEISNISAKHVNWAQERSPSGRPSTGCPASAYRPAWPTRSAVAGPARGSATPTPSCANVPP